MPVGRYAGRFAGTIVGRPSTVTVLGLVVAIAESVDPDKVGGATDHGVAPTTKNCSDQRHAGVPRQTVVQTTQTRYDARQKAFDWNSLTG